MILSDYEIAAYSSRDPIYVWVARNRHTGAVTAPRGVWEHDCVAYGWSTRMDSVRSGIENLNQSLEVLDIRPLTTDEVGTFRMITPFTSEVVRARANGERVISHGCSSFGYDLKLGNTFKVFRPAYRSVLDPKRIDENLMETVTSDEQIVIPANGFVLAHSVEYFKIPANVSVSIIGKSTYARVGNATIATPLEAGWEGEVTLEFANTTPVDQLMYPHEGCVQAQFFRGPYCTTSYADRDGKYQGQRGVTTSRL